MMAPVATMEEIPLLDAREREELLGSLKNAEAEIEAGKGVAYDPKSFRNRLLRIYRGKDRS